MEIECRIGKVLASLKANRFNAASVANREEARKIILETVPASASVGIGDSATVRQIGVIDELQKRGNAVVNPFAREFL